MIEIIPNWHPIFVHFSVALLLTSSALFAKLYLFPSCKYKEQLFSVARWNLWIGSIITILTIIAGAGAYNQLANNEMTSDLINHHRYWALSGASLFFIAAIWQKKQSTEKNISFPFLALVMVASILLAIAAYKGGELVYRHGIGVIAVNHIE